MDPRKGFELNEITDTDYRSLDFFAFLIGNRVVTSAESDENSSIDGILYCIDDILLTSTVNISLDIVRLSPSSKLLAIPFSKLTIKDLTKLVTLATFSCSCLLSTRPSSTRRSKFLSIFACVSEKAVANSSSLSKVLN